MNSVPAFQLSLEFELWDEFDREEDFFNMGVYLEDGSHYALNVWTHKYLGRAKEKDIQTGENLFGAYLIPPDLLIEKLDRDLIQATITDLFRRGQMKAEWLVMDEIPVNGGGVS